MTYVFVEKHAKERVAVLVPVERQRARVSLLVPPQGQEQVRVLLWLQVVTQMAVTV